MSFPVADSQERNAQDKVPWAVRPSPVVEDFTKGDVEIGTNVFEEVLKHQNLPSLTSSMNSSRLTA